VLLFPQRLITWLSLVVVLAQNIKVVVAVLVDTELP